MPIAGFSFRKISAERTEGTGTKINIENNVSVKNIEDIDIGLNKEGNKTLKFTFEFSVDQKQCGSHHPEQGCQPAFACAVAQSQREVSQSKLFIIGNFNRNLQ